ncbi:HSF-type DNA-binding [Musa troglodytarum]|uniref:HSF-type DNA-binding n=1 Tax=Musa troglodytarum TaxID=320322 RepID=A0A9E7JAE9_9LILI|nr:HSF-type DNA-binding [Musa troglodytarum]
MDGWMDGGSTASLHWLLIRRWLLVATGFPPPCPLFMSYKVSGKRAGTTATAFGRQPAPIYVRERNDWVAMEGTGEDGIGHQAQAAAPFVEKTYAMVNDPRTDSLIRWGKKNNSFLVLDPNEFSQFLLPCYFRHSNFSSFVRQLNTYGFRKVDPDGWEFAHQSFLRGQIHLLPRIIRRTKRAAHAGLFACSSSSEEEKGEVEEMLLQELLRLRQEQSALEEELQVMSKRLKATERRPHQMMSFLAKVADDPRSLSRLVISKQQQQQQQSSTAAKTRRRLIVSPPPPPPLPPHATQLDDALFLPSVLVPGIRQTMFEPLDHGSDQLIMEEVKPFALITDVSAINSYAAELITPNSASEISFVPEFELGMTGSETAAAAAEANFPFSLLGHGFY